MIRFHAFWISCFFFIFFSSARSLQTTAIKNEGEETSNSFVDSWRRRRTDDEFVVEDANHQDEKYLARRTRK